MDQKATIKFCRELGCCDACCVRFCALRRPAVFGNIKQYINELFPEDAKPETKEETVEPVPEPLEALPEAPPAKRSKEGDICVSCLGILQEDTWPECFNMTQEVLHKKKYSCSSFSCALSAPLAAQLRERALQLRLADQFPFFDAAGVTSLKEAWRGGAGAALAAHVGLRPASGAVAPLMVTLSMEYPDDEAECGMFAPSAEQLRRRQRRQRCGAPVTRCLLDAALADISLEALNDLTQWGRGVPAPRGRARCVSVEAHHEPIYIGGRYIKLSRSLPQSPWVVAGRRVMDSSVQEIIFQPIAELYGWDAAEAEGRLKFVSAGREDVDVRCLGEGRPFAVEVSDPRRVPEAGELAAAAARLARSPLVQVRHLQLVTKDKLAELKKGEESKYKTYEALCVKLTHTAEDIAADGLTAASPVAVTARDIARVNSWCGGGVDIVQRTPLRVLHRRALLPRLRRLLALHAAPLPDHPRLFVVRVQTEAGTYVKEWAHGELGRTRPALGAALGARCDILALDVAAVHLPWP